MEPSLVIAAFRCEVAGKPTDSIDIQVRYFATGTAAEIEERLRSQETVSYLNGAGETVSWPFVAVLAIEPFGTPLDGREVVGFITGHREFAKWSGCEPNGDVVPSA
jgi:hypothetical protein